ncbi:transglutaminase domain-containing protein [Fervidobacterium gondwanense]|uniref:transglutaminase domain-containing protein n=1 Tax=Fervidobacterium gondwanense TaxID=44754 RepID=UPI003C770B78
MFRKVCLVCIVVLISVGTMFIGQTYKVRSTDEIEKAIVTDILNFEPTTVLIAYGTNNSTMLKIVDSVIKSIGESVFLQRWEENSVEQLGTVTTTITYIYVELLAERKAVDDFIQKNISTILSGAKSDIDKILMINEWLKLNIEYDSSYTYKSAYATLKNRRGVCQGYALLFYRLAKAAGLQVYLVSGQAKAPEKGATDLQPHAWNVVKVGNELFYVDATWNDSTGVNAYLLFGTNQAKYSHYPETKLPGTISTKSYAEKLYEEIVRYNSRAARETFSLLYGYLVLKYDDLVNYVYYGLKNNNSLTFVGHGDFVASNLSRAVNDALVYANIMNVNYAYSYNYLFTTSENRDFYIWKISFKRN